MKTSIILFFCLLIAAKATFSQVFLKGNYVEIGIHSSGSFGSESIAPAGYHSPNWLGFICDFQRDGWDQGLPPFIGDYFVPGTPEEGWGIKWGTGDSAQIFHNFGLMMEVDIPKISESKESDAFGETAIWTGEAINSNEHLQIEQKVVLGTNNMFFTIEIMVKNTGTEILRDVKYYRNLDPDNEVEFTGDFTTSNYIKCQPGYNGNNDTAIVIAKGLIFNVPVILGTIDPRAVVTLGGFSNRDPDELLDSIFPPNINNPIVEDKAISLVFKLGDIQPGQCLSFSYYYGLEEIDPAIAMTPLTLDFTNGNTCGTKNINFQNASSGAGSLLISNCFWDFNNDNVFETEGLSTDYEFPYFGKYLVRMKIETCDGKSDTITKEVELRDFPRLNFSTDTTLCKGETLVLDATNAGSHYHWQDGAGTAVYSATESNDYRVQVTNICGSTYASIHAEFQNCDIIIPNIFTPNNDSQNDVFKIAEIEHGNWEIEVFNRWGLMLYKGNKIEEWDAEKSETGVYYYLVYNNDISVCKKGFFHLVR